MPDLRLGGTVDSPALVRPRRCVDDSRITIGGRTYRFHDSQRAVRTRRRAGADARRSRRHADWNYDVTIRINGTPDRIETSFSSVPPLGERDLQSLIVTGQAGEQWTQSANRDDKFAAAAAATDVLGFAGQVRGSRFGPGRRRRSRSGREGRRSGTAPDGIEVARIVVRADLLRQSRGRIGHVGAGVETDPAQRDPRVVGRGRHAIARISAVVYVRARFTEWKHDRDRRPNSHVPPCKRFGSSARRDSARRS